MPLLQWQPGFVGKIAAQADFLRVQASTPQAQALHRWLEDANEALVRGAHTLPASDTTFVFAGIDGIRAGTFAPGRDKVGRIFPSAVFAMGAPFSELALLPALVTPFSRAAAALLARSGEVDAAELTRNLALLPLPTDAELSRVREERRAQLLAPQGGRLQAAFQGLGAPDCHLYAVRTFLQACDAERKNEPGRAGLALDCPLTPEVGPAFWMDLFVRRCPKWSAVSFLWTPDRLLVGFGAPSGAWLPFLAKPDHPSMKRWPLVTQQSSAVDAARSALSLSAKSAIDQRDVSLDGMLGALATA